MSKEAKREPPVPVGLRGGRKSHPFFLVPTLSDLEDGIAIQEGLLERACAAVGTQWARRQWDGPRRQPVCMATISVHGT